MGGASLTQSIEPGTARPGFLPLLFRRASGAQALAARAGELRGASGTGRNALRRGGAHELRHPLQGPGQGKSLVRRARGREAPSGSVPGAPRSFFAAVRLAGLQRDAMTGRITVPHSGPHEHLQGERGSSPRVDWGVAPGGIPTGGVGRGREAPPRIPTPPGPRPWPRPLPAFKGLALSLQLNRRCLLHP